MEDIDIRLSVTPILPHLGQLADLHVYLVPVECWASSQKLFCTYVIQEAVSYGFVRVQTQVNLHDLRHELKEQLENDVLPKEYVFLKSVGRNFARVKEKQEYQLRVRDFVPPNATEPELYLLEIIPQTDTNQNEKKKGRGRTALASPSHLPTLASPVNDLSSPAGVVSGSPSALLLPPVSPSRAKVAGVSNKNRATSSIGVVAVDPKVKLPSIQTKRPKSEPRSSPRKTTPRTQSAADIKPKSLLPPPPPPPPLPPAQQTSKTSIRPRTKKVTSNGRRVSVTANVLKKRPLRSARAAGSSAIIAHQRIIVPNGRRAVARSTSLPDVTEESESGGDVAPVVPMRVEGPERQRLKTSYGYNYRAVQKVIDSPQGSTDDELRDLGAAAGDSKSEEEKCAVTKPRRKWDGGRLKESAVIPIGRTGRLRGGIMRRPISTVSLRSAQQAAILKYELTVSELKDLRHAACHTSEQTSRPIMYRRSRPIARTVWYPRPLHEGGNPPSLLRIMNRRGRRSKTLRGDAGHAYYTSTSETRRNQKKKKRVDKEDAAFRVIQPVEEVVRPPFSKAKRKKKRPELRLEPGVAEIVETVVQECEEVVKDCPAASGGCCDWVIDNISLEEFTNSEEKRKQVLQPIRQAAQERRKKAQKEVRERYKNSSPDGATVLLCSVDRPR